MKPQFYHQCCCSSGAPLRSSQHHTQHVSFHICHTLLHSHNNAEPEATCLHTKGGNAHQVATSVDKGVNGCVVWGAVWHREGRALYTKQEINTSALKMNTRMFHASMPRWHGLQLVLLGMWSEGANTGTKECAVLHKARSASHIRKLT